MNHPYTSFLICDRGNTADIYVNGLPIGVLNVMGFTPTKIDNGRDIVDIRLQGSQYLTKTTFKRRLIEIIEKAIVDDE